MNRYLIYKELKEILEMCKKAGFDLYSWTRKEGIIFTKISEIMEIFKEYNNRYLHERPPTLNLWISKEGPCLKSRYGEIRVVITDDNITYYYGYNSEIVYEICKEEIFDLLIEWRRESSLKS